jgi:hypothetical protein
MMTTGGFKFNDDQDEGDYEERYICGLYSVRNILICSIQKSRFQYQSVGLFFVVHCMPFPLLSVELHTDTECHLFQRYSSVIIVR